MSIPTGINRLDDLLNGGLSASSITVVGSAPGMGTTSFLLNTVYQTCFGYPVLYLSLQRPMSKVLNRLLSVAEAYRKPSYEDHSPTTQQIAAESLPSDKARQVARTQDDVLERSHLSLSDSFIERDDLIGFVRTWLQGIASDERWKELAVRRAEEHTALLIVDDIQHITTVDRVDTRDEELRRVMSAFRQLSVGPNPADYPVACLLASQLNRSNESPELGEFRLNELRDSGSIENFTDTVLFLHRPDYYNLWRPDGPPPAEAHPFEFVVAKNTLGSMGRFYQSFDLLTGQISDFDTDLIPKWGDLINGPGTVKFKSENDNPTAQTFGSKANELPNDKDFEGPF